MRMDEPDECRICCEQGQYNIFNDELCFDARNTTKLKIYIVLNNFLFEKLYSQDEHSSFICHTCCNSLCDSYTFMTGVRKSEQDQKHRKKLSSPVNLNTENLEPVDEQSVDADEAILEENITTPDNIYENEDEIYELRTVEKVVPKIDKKEHCQEMYIQLPAKRPKVLPGTPDSIVYTHYELVTSYENDQNVVSLNVSARCIERPKDGNYEFDSSWLDHQADAATIYKCQHCIKAFSNADFLLKHTLSSHLCLVCFESVDNYKELNKHSKNHTSVTCHFCDKTCGSTSIFRQHLKKNHKLQIPNHIGILSNSHKDQ